MAQDPYREVFERSADAILIIEGGRFVDCNQATVEMLRYENREQLLQTHPSELSPPEQPDGRPSFEKADEMIAIAFEEGSHRFEWMHQRADGEVFPVEVLLTAVRREERDTLHVVWRDISDRRNLEEQLRQTQKMEAIGKLAGGIAHDFNNLLVALIGHAELLSFMLEDEAALEHLRAIEGAADRAAMLVKQLLAFGRKEKRTSRVIDLGAVVDDLQKLLRRLIGEDIAFLSRLDEGIRVRSDKGAIEQIVLNLAANARDAMPHGGRLTLELGSVQLERSPTDAIDPVEPGAYAVLEISDDGEGMCAEVIRRAVEPFFTTKEVGKGTGLGLSTVYAIARQVGGTLAIESEPGAGTAVRVYLPQVFDAAAPEVSRRSGLPVRGGSERILVVEDDPTVAAIVVETLRQNGYAVTLANDGREALEVWEAKGGAFDLLLSDVIMPRMGGPALVRELESRGYAPRVLFASGYTDDAISAIEGEGFGPLLTKPFTPSQLVGHVRQTLDGNPRD